MGLGSIFRKTKDIKAVADAENKREKIEKEVEKTKKVFENKRDKEIMKLKETQAHQMSLKKSDYKAYVVVNLVNGTLTEELAVLGAEVGYKNEQPVLRVKDKEENIIFEEPKPDAIDEFNYVDEKTIDKKLADCKNAIDKIQSGAKQQIEGKYESDWLEEYRKWKAKKTHVQLGEKGSYMKIRDGAPHYEFDLVGYFKIPVYRYTSKSTISIPPLGKIITGQVLMKKISDEINVDKRDAQKLMNTIYGILIAIALIGSLLLMYYSGQTDATISENLAKSTQSLSSLINHSNEINAIQNDLHNLTQAINTESPTITTNPKKTLE